MKIPQFIVGDRVAFMRIAFDSNGHIGNIVERNLYGGRFQYDVLDDFGTTWLAVPESALVGIVEAKND